MVLKLHFYFTFGAINVGNELDIMGRGVLVASNMKIANSIAPLVKHINYPRD